MAKKQVQQEVQAGGGSQLVIRLPKLSVYEDKNTQEKLQALAAEYRQADEVATQLQPCVNVFNAANDKMAKIHEAILETMRADGIKTFETEVGTLSLLTHEGSNPQIRPGTNQLEKFYAQKNPDKDNLITSLLIDLKKDQRSKQEENNKLINLTLDPEDKNNVNPPKVFSADLAYKTPLASNGHEAHLTLEVARFSGIPGVSWYSYSSIKALEGKQIRCQYEKVTDSPHGTDVHVREGKDYEEMHGWVDSNYGVWRSQKGHVCLELRNYNRIVNGDRKSVTEEDLEKAKALGRLTPGEFRPTCLRIEGIKPRTLEYMHNGKWEPVDPR